MSSSVKRHDVKLSVCAILSQERPKKKRIQAFGFIQGVFNFEFCGKLPGGASTAGGSPSVGIWRWFPDRANFPRRTLNFEFEYSPPNLFYEIYEKTVLAVACATSDSRCHSSY